MALSKKGEGIENLVSDEREAQAETLLEMIDATLTGNGLEKDAIDVLIANRGPTSFTTLRIALSLAEGLSAALGVPVFGIDSMTALAMTARLKTLCPARFHVATDTYRRQALLASFDASGPVPELTGSIRTLDRCLLQKEIPRDEVLFFKANRPDANPLESADFSALRNCRSLDEGFPHTACGMLTYFLLAKRLPPTTSPVEPYYAKEPEAVVNLRLKRGEIVASSEAERGALLPSSSEEQQHP